MLRVCEGMLLWLAVVQDAVYPYDVLLWMELSIGRVFGMLTETSWNMLLSK